jgi:hypothetical protein
MMERQRCAIEFCARLIKSSSETLQLVHQAYGVHISPHSISGLFQPRNGSSEVRKPPVPLSSWSLQQTICSTFSRSGWNLVRSESLAKGGNSKKRPSPHLHKISSWSNNVKPRILQTSLVTSTTSHHWIEGLTNTAKCAAASCFQASSWCLHLPCTHCSVQYSTVT